MKAKQIQISQSNSIGNLSPTRKFLLAICWLMLFLSFPQGVKCGFRDILETTSTIILFLLAAFVFFTMLGYYARKRESKKGMTRF